ncbi:MAG: hypothetical protein K2Q20_07350 [Phycisphaerales bacterium]|nr:hypothetical protein [Phycisphaerales bacterium]
MKMSALLAIAAVGASSAVVLATPAINSAVLNTRVFNDNPGSTLATTNSYPSLVQFNDSNLTTGFANRHNFRLSTNSSTGAVFNNADSFIFSTDVTITGPGNAEAGINVSPWYSQNVDGTFNLRTSDGEVAIFGGRLPFYSFTSSNGITYTKGTTVRLGVEYNANGLSSSSPGSIRYSYNNVQSPWLAFDEGNPAEGVVYGNWGILEQARVGGYTQILGSPSGPQGNVATFGNIFFVPAPGAAGLMGLAGLLAARRRR